MGAVDTRLASASASARTWSSGHWPLNTPAATTASARPCCTAATCARASLEIVTVIASGNPSGRAAADHERKRGLRTSRTPRLGANATIRYGPVPGAGRLRIIVAGVPDGSTYASGMASFWGNSASGRRRWMVIVRAAASVWMPFARSHRRGPHDLSLRMPS
jgi:hypothetical protein